MVKYLITDPGQIKGGKILPYMPQSLVMEPKHAKGTIFRNRQEDKTELGKLERFFKENFDVRIIFKVSYKLIVVLNVHISDAAIKAMIKANNFNILFMYSEGNKYIFKEKG